MAGLQSCKTCFKFFVGRFFGNKFLGGAPLRPTPPTALFQWSTFSKEIFGKKFDFFRIFFWGGQTPLWGGTPTRCGDPLPPLASPAYLSRFWEDFRGTNLGGKLYCWGEPPNPPPPSGGVPPLPPPPSPAPLGSFWEVFCGKNVLGKIFWGETITLPPPPLGAPSGP